MKRIEWMMFVVLALTVSLVACTGTTTKRTDNLVSMQPTDGVEVLYFHGKQRCASCNAIEKLTREVVDSLNNSKITLRVIDISKKENQPLADHYEVSWSSLLLLHNGKVENLTAMGFASAKNNPKAFRRQLTEALSNQLR